MDVAGKIIVVHYSVHRGNRETAQRLLQEFIDGGLLAAEVLLRQIDPNHDIYLLRTLDATEQD